MTSSNSKKIKFLDPTAVEFDDSSSSSGDLSYAASVDSDEDEEQIGRLLAHINITDHLSTLELPDVLTEWPEDPFKYTELVIKFSPHIRLAALLWFIERVTAPKSKGGAELLLLREPYYGRPKEGLTLHVTAATWRQLEVAEQLDIKKIDYTTDEPCPTYLRLNEIMKFMQGDSMAPEDILTPAEKQMVVFHELMHLHSRPGEKHVPGYERYKLITGASIFNVFETKGLITTYFALHEEKDLQKLAGKWCWGFFDEYPYEDIRSYFGDKTCLFFNFIAYYTYALSFPAVIGLIILCFYFIKKGVIQMVSMYIALFNMMFVTIYLVLWQRHQSRITFLWGTIKVNFWEEPRANYHGILALDPVTGSLQRRYPYYKTFIKTYIISSSFVLLCCGFSLWVMIVFQQLDVDAKRYAKPLADSAEGFWDMILWQFVFPQLPVVGYAIYVFLSTLIYRYIANQLTEWENHRTESQFEKHLVIKMVIFEVVNNFGVLYYTGFVVNDLELLAERLFSMIVVVQVCVLIDQCIRPVFFRTSVAKMHEFLAEQRIFTALGVNISSEGSSKPIPYPGLEKAKVSVMDVNDPRVKISKVEGTMDPYNYEADFDEYLFLFLQFGYTFLFSAVNPVAALYAFIINIFFLMASLYKRREVYRRVLAIRVSNIGAWKQAFDALAVLAVITNCALIYKNPEVKNSFPQYNDNEWFLLFVCIEHGILIVQYFVKKMIPKIPHKVKVGLAAQEFKSHQALKREQATTTRRRVTRYFAPINEKLVQKNKEKEMNLEKENRNKDKTRHHSKPGSSSGSGSTPNPPRTSSEIRHRRPST